MIRRIVRAAAITAITIGATVAATTAASANMIWG